MRARKFRFILISFVALIAIIYGFIYFQSLKGDIQLPSDTKSLIAAIKEDDQGSHVVAMTQDGTLTESGGLTPGKSDRDITWDPQGNRLFFVSDRKDDSFHIFRWDPARNNIPEQRSIDRAGRSNLSFDVQDPNSGEISALITVRGTVQEFFPQTGKSIQLLCLMKNSEYPFLQTILSLILER